MAQPQINGGNRDDYTDIAPNPKRPNKKNPFRDTDLVKPAEQNRTQYEPGTPWWWLDRLILRLMDRMDRYDTLENYALGYHPLPNLDLRFVRALKDLQKMSRTNYCDLVIRATVERMKVKGFRFGPVGEADTEAKEIWDYNDMDYQSPMNLNLAATFGFCYALVSPPDPKDENAKPGICIEDPRMCIVERDPYKPTRSIAGLKMWVDDILQTTVAMLYLPDYVYTFSTRKYNEEPQDPDAYLTKKMSNAVTAGSFELVLIQNNELGEVPLVEGRWQPSFGDLGRAEHENVLDIQDRINRTVLDRLVIAKNQAYRQRWASGVQMKGAQGAKRPPFDPGSDVLWVTESTDAKFGDFEAADITQLIEALKDDVGNLAAVSQTPAGYLMNQMVNVSGDTLTKEQSALVSKIKNRSDAMGWFYERCMKLAFKYTGNEEKSSTVEAQVLWADPEIRSMAEVADAAAKWVAAEVPLQLIMERAGFSPDEIDYAIKERDRQRELLAQREDMIAQRDGDMKMKQDAANMDGNIKRDAKNADNNIRVEKSKPRPTSSSK